MIVQAKWNLAYKGVQIKGGQLFDIEPMYFNDFKNDVVVVKEIKEEATKEVKTETNKQVKKSTVKTK